MKDESWINWVVKAASKTNLGLLMKICRGSVAFDGAPVIKLPEDGIFLHVRLSNIWLLSVRNFEKAKHSPFFIPPVDMNEKCCRFPPRRTSFCAIIISLDPLESLWNKNHCSIASHTHYLFPFLTHIKKSITHPYIHLQNRWRCVYHSICHSDAPGYINVILNHITTLSKSFKINHYID